MNQTWVNQLNAACNPRCTEIKNSTACFCLEAQGLLPAVHKAYELELYLQDVSAADFQEGYLLTYHFGHFQESGQVVFRVMVPQEPGEVPSISSVYQGAIWHEQECFDFYGIIFTDHPDLKPLLLVPDENLFPLRKSASSKKSFHDVFPGCGLVEAPPAPEEGDEGSHAEGKEPVKAKKVPRKAKEETAREEAQE